MFNILFRDLDCTVAMFKRRLPLCAQSSLLATSARDTTTCEDGCSRHKLWYGEPFRNEPGPHWLESTVISTGVQACELLRTKKLKELPCVKRSLAVNKLVGHL